MLLDQFHDTISKYLLPYHHYSFLLFLIGHFHDTISKDLPIYLLYSLLPNIIDNFNNSGLGLELGFDRIFMLLVCDNQIRDVIAFPKTTSAMSLMDQSPSEVDASQLDDLGIDLKKK